MSQYAGDVRGLGLNLAVDLVRDHTTKERSDRASRRPHGVLRGGRNLVQTEPGQCPESRARLVITQDEIDYVLEVLQTGLASLSTTTMH